MASLFWGTSTAKFDEDVDRATAETLPSGGENLELNFEISDYIRSKNVGGKEAMRSIKRRLNHKNPNVQLLALSLTDTCLKNSGDHFLAEIASREFMDNLVSILKVPAVNIDVRSKILQLVQNWAVFLESKPTMSYVGEVYKRLQKEGFSFPPRDPVTTSAAMIDTLTPPEWVDSDVCLRCRTPFSFTNRKHHCRSCGLVFDQQCSTKVIPLPHLGIQQPVRVCDSCWHKSNKVKATEPAKSSQLARRSSTQHKSSRQLADEELQRAIQLSLEEANGTNHQHGPRKVPNAVSEPPLVDSRPAPVDEEDDPELRAAIEASLREANAPRASAPVVEPTRAPDPYPPASGYSPSYLVPEPLPNYDLDPTESDAILTFSQTVEVAHSQGTSDLPRHQAVSEMYDRANGMRPKLARSLDDAGRKEQMLAEMNEKLSQAAKLYDHLLTIQVSNPARYRSPNGARHQEHQQPYTPSHGPPQSISPTPWPPQQQESYHQASFSPPQTRSPIASYQPATVDPNRNTMYQARTTQWSSLPQSTAAEPVQQETYQTPSSGYESQFQSPLPVSIPMSPQPEAGLPQFTPQPEVAQPAYHPSPPEPAHSASTVPYPRQLTSPPPQQHAGYSPAYHQPHPPQPNYTSNLPTFPSAPTAPLPQPVYRAPVEPQKEAMLISFD